MLDLEALFDRYLSCAFAKRRVRRVGAGFLDFLRTVLSVLISRENNKRTHLALGLSCDETGEWVRVGGPLDEADRLIARGSGARIGHR